MSTLDQLLLDADTNDEFIRNMMTALVSGSKEASKLPTGADFRAAAALDSDFAASTKASCQQSVELLNLLCDFVRPEAPPGSSLKENQRLPDDISDPMLYDQVIDTIDILLSGADVLLEQAEAEVGITKVATAVGSSAVLDKDRLFQTQSSGVKEKPQDAFLFEIDNHRMTPFKPRLKEKHHALPDNPLQLELRRKPRIDDVEQFELTAVGYIAGSDGHEDDVMMSTEERALIGENWRTVVQGPDQYYPHPYEKELQNMKLPQWSQEQPVAVNKKNFPSKASDIPDLIAGEDQLDELISKLSQQLQSHPELAVDLEHHSLRTFQGLTCLMQLSTRFEDFIIDTLALRQSVHKLGVFFMDPAIVKVLHGCEKDVLWLQRDLGLYIVNCFDTYIAAKVLQLPALSLAHLLKIYCGGLLVDKKHQLSDWRLRPLPKEMLQYARDDTHYLLHVYDVMRNEIWLKVNGKEGLEQVYYGSLRLCLQRYEKPLFYPQGYRRLLGPSRMQQNGTSNKQSSYRRGVKEKYRPSIDEIGDIQDAALSTLWDWRDAKARELDESCGYLMPNAALLRIVMTLPRSPQQLRDECSPLNEFIDENADAICDMLHQAINPGGTSVQSNPDQITNKRSATVTYGSPTAAGLMGGAKSYPSSVHTFIPAVQQMNIFSHSPSPTTPISQPVSSKPLFPINSPLLSAEEVFSHAEWQSPGKETEDGNFADGTIIAPSLDSRWPVIGTNAAHTVSTENQLRVRKSEEEYQRKLQETKKGLFDRLYGLMGGAAGQPSTNPSESSGVLMQLAGEHGGAEDVVIAEDRSNTHDANEVNSKGDSGEDEDDYLIPESMAEITRKSQLIKQRNKDKKRAGIAVGDSIEIDESQASLASSILDGNSTLRDSNASNISIKNPSLTADLYFTSPYEKIDNSVDGTLQFAQRIGWLQSTEECQEVKKQYENDLLSQQMPENEATAHISQVGGTGSSAAHGGNASTTHSQNFDMQSVGSGTGSRTGSRDGGVQRQKKNSNKSPHQVQPFDYSALNQNAANPLSIIPPTQQQQHSHSGHGRGNRGGGRGRNNAGRNNPYLYGGSR